MVLKGSEFVLNLKKGIEEKWQGFKDGVRSKVVGIIDSIGSWFSSLLGKGRAAISNLWTGISERWTSLREAVHSRVTSIVEAIGDWFRGLVSKGKAAISSLWEGINDRWNGLRSDISGRVSAMVSAIGSWFAGIWSVGRNIVTGLWNGISSGWGWLTSQVSNLARSLLKTAKRALGIKSPSTEFALIGRFIDEGLSRGIDEFEKVPLKAVRQLAVDVIDDFGVPDVMGAIDSSVVAMGSREININAVWSGTMECDGYTLGQVVLRNIDDAAAFTLRG